MDPMTVSTFERITERFGFPVFISLCAMVLFIAVWRYFSRELTMTRKDFTDYLRARDEQVDKMMTTLNDSYNRNTIAVVELKNAVSKRLAVEEEQLKTLSNIDKRIATDLK